jgi:hypothetical protein
MEVIGYIALGVLLVVALLIFRYRWTKTQLILEEVELIYRMVDLGKGGGIRFWLESLLGNKRFFLANNRLDIPWIYLNKKEWKKICPVPPIQMKQQGYSVQFTLLVNRLRIQLSPKKVVYGRGKVRAYQRINQALTVLKS